MALDIDRAMGLLRQEGNFFELYHVTTFTGYRRRKQGDVQEVEITILDARDTGPVRYQVSAKDEDGREASGNGGDSLTEAIGTMHWGDLDQD